MKQHEYLQQQTISNPKKQDSFNRKEQNDGSTPSEFHCEREADATANYVAHRIQNRITLIAQRRRRFAIPLNDGVSIFDYLPATFDDNRHYESAA